MDRFEQEKRAAAEAAALAVEDGMTVGLGTGTTVAHLFPALANRGVNITCVATSPATEAAARAAGLQVDPFDALDRVDVAVDGADQVTPELWLIKGRGGAQTREKIVAAAADRFIVIVSSNKLVDALEPPLPLEVMPFGVAATLRMLSEFGPLAPRDEVTPDGNVQVDFLGPVQDPGDLAMRLDGVPGVVGHGLFSPELVSEVIVGKADGSVERLTR